MLHEWAARFIVLDPTTIPVGSYMYTYRYICTLYVRIPVRIHERYVRIVAVNLVGRATQEREREGKVLYIY